jgi:hypothetical protein
MPTAFLERATCLNLSKPSKGLTPQLARIVLYGMTAQAREMFAQGPIPPPPGPCVFLRPTESPRSVGFSFLSLRAHPSCRRKLQCQLRSWNARHASSVPSTRKG